MVDLVYKFFFILFIAWIVLMFMNNDDNGGWGF